MPKQRTPVPESITELLAQLEQFRSTHPLRTKLPESVWQSGAELARCHGRYVVARSLRLDYCTLKKHVTGSPETSSRRRQKPEPQFVEQARSCQRMKRAQPRYCSCGLVRGRSR